MRQNTFRAALGLLAAGSAAGLLVILGTHFSDAATRPATGVRAPVPVLPYPLLIALLLGLGAVLVYSVVRFGVALFRDPGTVPRKKRKDSRQTIAMMLIMVALLAVVFFAAGLVMSLMEIPEEENSEPTGQVEQGEADEAPEELPEELPPEESSPSLDEGETGDRSRLIMLLATALVAVVAGVIGVRAYRRYAARPVPEEGEAFERLSADLRSTSGKGLERMLDEPDDRRAVIAAYALVEETFERHGYPHSSSQTPVEFMRATLAELESRSARRGAGDAHDVSRRALLTLTKLYEVARFSEHPVGPAERRQGVECLERIGSAIAPLGGGRGSAPGAHDER